MKLTCKTLFPFFFLLLAACSGGQKDIPVEDASTWMKELNDSLPLCKISVPGSHDSGACRNGGVFIKTQDIDIATQLKEGIRFFDIRLQAMPDGKLGIYHGPFFQDIYWEENVLADFISFLQANPSETLIVSLKKENGELTDYAKLLSSVLSKPEYQSYFVDNFRQDLTLGDCRGKILFMHRDHAMDNYHGAECFDWADNATCMLTVRSKDGEEGKVTVEDEYQYSSSAKADYKVETCIRNIDKIAAEPENSYLWAFTFVSATAVPVSGPIHFAEKVNEPVAKHIQEMSKKNCGIVIIDFAGSEQGQMLVKALIDNNAG